VDTAYNASIGILRDTYAKYQGNMEERNALYAAKDSRWQGGQALLAGAVRAGSTAITGYFNYKDMVKGGLGITDPRSRSRAVEV
jgi:hypothetical protein